MRPVLLVGLIGLLLLSGCASGAPARTPHVLAAASVGEMAEDQLESAHADLARGSIACGSLAFRVGASVRCVRTAVLSGGRQIRVNGTVEVTSVAGGGKLHVQLDDDVAEFGITGEQVGDDLTAYTSRAYGVRPTAVTCGSLTGRVGTTIGCQVRFGDQPHLLARATVTAVDPAAFRTTVAFSYDPVANPDLRQQLSWLRGHGYADGDS